jgi:hypothetical protein
VFFWYVEIDLGMSSPTQHPSQAFKKSFLFSTGMCTQILVEYKDKEMVHSGKGNKLYCTLLTCVKYGFSYKRCKVPYLFVFWRFGIRKEGTLRANERGGLTKRY